MSRSDSPNPILSPLLEAATGVRHGFFTREGGVSSGLYAGLNCGRGSDDCADAVEENRRRVSAHLSSDALNRLNTLYQVHGTDIVRFPQNGEAAKFPKADGAVTDQPGQILAILTADCAPVLFADVAAGIIGACHAGWRGAFDGVVEQTVLAMTALGAERSRICATIGPCIAQSSYQVGPDFLSRFLEADPGHEKFFVPDDEGRHRFDLRGFVLDRLQTAGIGDAIAIDADTCADADRFFSYRRATLTGEADYGRMVSAIMLETRD